MNAVLDPLADAVQAAESSGNVFGKLDIEGQYIVLQKGQRKRAWVEGESLDGRVSEITLRVNPLDVSGLTYMTERQVLANSREWSNIVWPSLRDLGVKSLYEVRGKWVKVTMVKNGESYVAKQGAKAGQTIEKTTFKFLGIYDTEAEANAAWESQFGTSQAHTPSSNGNGAAAPQPTNDAERTAALSFLPAIVNANKSDLTKLAAALASMSPLNKYFTIDSAEVQALLGA